MNLAELSSTPWYKDNIQTLMHSGPRSDARVKKVVTALASSNFQDAMKVSEEFLALDPEVQSTAAEPKLRNWLIQAASFSRSMVIMLAHVGPFPPPPPVAPDVQGDI